MRFNKNSIVKHGVYLYGNSDHEDPPEIANDQEVLCYYCGFENLVNKGEFNPWSGAYLSIDEAVSYAESSLPITWN